MSAQEEMTRREFVQAAAIAAGGAALLSAGRANAQDKGERPQQVGNNKGGAYSQESQREQQSPETSIEPHTGGIVDLDGEDIGKVIEKVHPEDVCGNDPLIVKFRFYPLQPG